ncbi:cytochrome c-555 precursor [bacterium BMS3Bbin11]|nr:cytochrome c-555 precursor [bacterium BMS3Bbin11]HDH08712.1 cytochrome c5 family protein [Gammaproteobacteria bacterium]HDH15393.1 cytochrome c5 family protein [Gammaproteobacteria bacterium]
MKLITSLVMAASLFAIAGNASAQGNKIYDTKCFICHASGVAGAPKLGDKAAWAPRIATGMDAIMAIVIKGKGAMPPKGTTCVDCSDADLKGVVEYMISKSK